MKTVLKGILLASVVMIAGCGGDDGTPASRPADEPSAAAAPVKALSVGDTATLNYGALDDPDGVGALKVTVTKIDDPLAPPSDDEFVSENAAAGNRYVAVHVRIENIGDRVYNDALYGSTQLIDDEGNVAEAVQLIGWSCESAFNATIASQASSSGCEVYELPAEIEPASFVLTQGETTLATWDLGD